MLFKTKTDKRIDERRKHQKAMMQRTDIKCADARRQILEILDEAKHAETSQLENALINASEEIVRICRAFIQELANAGYSPEISAADYIIRSTGMRNYLVWNALAAKDYMTVISGMEDTLVIGGLSYYNEHPKFWDTAPMTVQEFELMDCLASGVAVFLKNRQAYTGRM